MYWNVDGDPGANKVSAQAGTSPIRIADLLWLHTAPATCTVSGDVVLFLGKDVLPKTNSNRLIPSATGM